MLEAHILVKTLPLPRDYDEGETIVIVEKGKEFKMKLIADAFKGEREIRAIPVDRPFNA